MSWLEQKRDTMKQRSNTLRKRFAGSWMRFRRLVTPVLAIGTVMIICSILLMSVGNGILQAAGTAMLAAGLTIITTTLTTREAVKQQFARDTNTSRKDAMYGPLYVELKQIYEWLDKAKRKEERYPFYIYGPGGEPESTAYLRNLTYPTFRQWPQFKQDYRIDSFTPRACSMLNEAQELIETYNIAMSDTLNPATHVLAPHVEKALSAWKQSKSFKEWDQRSSKDPVWQGDPLHYWHVFLKRQPSPLSEVATTLAKTWLGRYGGLGWCVAGAKEKAALSIRSGQHTPPNDPAPDLPWFQDIIDEAWSELDDLQEIKKARIAAETLQFKVREVEDHLESGIRFIRDQYEGGEPPV